MKVKFIKDYNFISLDNNVYTIAKGNIYTANKITDGYSINTLLARIIVPEDYLEEIKSYNLCNKHMITAIKNTLSDAAVQKIPVIINPFQRAIGKTTALIEFAKENGFGVFVNYNAKELRASYNYDYIFDSLDTPNFNIKYVFDECVDRDKITQKWGRIQFITGFKVIS